jgi:hypothetical protein
MCSAEQRCQAKCLLWLFGLLTIETSPTCSLSALRNYRDGLVKHHPSRWNLNRACRCFTLPNLAKAFRWSLGPILGDMREHQSHLSLLELSEPATRHELKTHLSTLLQLDSTSFRTQSLFSRPLCLRSTQLHSRSCYTELLSLAQVSRIKGSKVALSGYLAGLCRYFQRSLELSCHRSSWW